MNSQSDIFERDLTDYPLTVDELIRDNDETLKFRSQKD